MRVGFTGTQQGMSRYQVFVVSHWLARARFLGCQEMHHGDCKGADRSAHDLALLIRLPVVIHPPADTRKRAYSALPEESEWNIFYEITVLDPKPYLERNRDIVDACDALLAAPNGGETLRSGTWSTVRYARKQGKPITLVMPSGNLYREGEGAATGHRLIADDSCRAS